MRVTVYKTHGGGHKTHGGQERGHKTHVEHGRAYENGYGGKTDVCIYVFIFRVFDY